MTRRQNFILIVTLGILNALTPFSIDMYLPAFPQIAGDLNVPVAQIALTASIYFVGFAFGQILYGPLLDRFGRKPPLYLGVGLYVLASLGCMQAQSMQELLIFRFVSALGGCAASVGATAMVRDFFPVEAASRVFSMLMLVLSVSPLLAPAIGSLVVSVAGWREIFAILCSLGVIDLLLIAFVLPKGYEADKTVNLMPAPILRGFWNVLRTPQFSTYTLAGSFSFAGLFVYVAGSPVIFMEGFKVSPQVYGLIFAFLAAGMIGGGQLNLLLIRRLGERKTFRTALIMQVLAATVFFAGDLRGAYGLVATIIFLFLILLGAGITSPNAAALALQPFSRNVGSAAALLGFMQLGIGALISAGVGLLSMKGSLPTSAAMFLSTCCALMILMCSVEGRSTSV